MAVEVVTVAVVTMAVVVMRSSAECSNGVGVDGGRRGDDGCGRGCGRAQRSRPSEPTVVEGGL